ncbi:MAG: MmcQ/YjbR family DNA-binding protein [Bacteroidota bacterium]|jgi:hypothetical protein
MVTIETARQFALSLQAVEEYDHVGRPAFRANGRTFATLWVNDDRMMIILPLIEQDVFCKFNSAIIYPVPNKWGLKGCTLFELKEIREDMLQDAITLGWQTVMNKKPTKKSPKK